MKLQILLLLVITQLVNASFGNVRLSFPFGDNMVLQREMNTPVRGTANPGEEVTVSFNGQTHSAIADNSGKWELFLDPMQAGGPYTFEAMSVNNTVTFSNVLVGDVWFCSGQSNMARPLRIHYTTDTLLTGIGNLRVADGKGQSAWKESTKEAVENITATGFYFARNLVLELGVPIGIIEVAWGGTSLEQWLDPLTVSEIPYLTWGEEFGERIVGERWPLMTDEIQFGIKGILWYQGEANANRNTLAPYYAEHLEYLIKGWRRQWGQGDIPFYIVQLPNFRAKQTVADPLNLHEGWPVVREAQRLALNIPNTGLATTIDIGEADDIHPKNKWDVGLRLALIARAFLYGETDLVYSGPVYKSKSIEGNQIRLKFVNVGSGLVSATGENLEGFIVLDANGNYEWGNALIDGDEVVVTAPGLNNPTDVAYAWANNPIISLYNAEGLPAGPFKTTGDQVSLTRFGCRQGAKDTTITVHDARVCETGFLTPVEGISFGGCPSGEVK